MYFKQDNSKREVVIYFIYPNLDFPKEILYLKKKCPNRPIIDGKLIGIGGKLYYDEDSITGLEREIVEELGMLPKGFQPIKQGIISPVKDLSVEVYKSPIHEKVLEKEIREGIITYKDSKHHKNSPQEFPENDLKFLNKLIFSNDSF